ncbi:MAG TPA: hypothetical protein VLX12_00580 [Syntrophorhabdales bacterium]|nr:hypothetical protein [Syntrophorhabdales bacterium]
MSLLQTPVGRNVEEHAHAASTETMAQHPNLSTFQISPGEIHYLYWYIQGSIMEPETRQALRKAWGFCERHAWAAMLVESAFRPSFFHGPSVLYEDIMTRALPAFDVSGPLQTVRLRINLRDKGPCFMCEMGYGPESRGKANKDIIEIGEDPVPLRTFAHKTEEHWAKTVCGSCTNSNSPERCRPHLLEDACRGLIDSIAPHREMVKNIYRHLVVYARSFVWEYNGTATDEDKASLISAVGWCSGWRPLFQILS